MAPERQVGIPVTGGFPREEGGQVTLRKSDRP